MAGPGQEITTLLKIQKVVEAVLDERQKKPMSLPNLARTPIVNAENGELMARFEGHILIADLVALDSVAGVYSTGKLTFESSKLPKIKIGRSFTESQIDQLSMLQGQGFRNETAMFDFFTPVINNCLMGIEHRLEAMLIAMKRDRFDYDKLGYKAENVTWGMPSDLKVTPTYPWTDHTNADPVDDILTLIEIGSVRYGIEYNRVVMSKQAFREAIQCTKFQNRALLYLPNGITFTNISQYNYPEQQRLFEAVTGCTIEFNDHRYWYQTEAGVNASARFHPINEVFLESTSTDNNAAAIDIGNGTVIESALLGMTNGSLGSGTNPVGMPSRGPIAYYALANQQLNPPGITMWAAQTAFPRKHLLQANAKLVVGQFADDIAVTEVS